MFVVAAILSAAANSSVFVVIAVLALLLPYLAVLVRRLYDTSRWPTALGQAHCLNNAGSARVLGWGAAFHPGTGGSA